MRVRAGKRSDYLFELEYWERTQLDNAELGHLRISSESLGMTFSVYDSVPERMIKSEIFKEKESPKTRAILGKNDFLTDLGLCVHVISGEIIDCDFVLENSSMTITPDHYRYICNHIPQLFYPYRGKRIVFIDGDYDFSTGLFKGMLVFE